MVLKVTDLARIFRGAKGKRFSDYESETFLVRVLVSIFSGKIVTYDLTPSVFMASVLSLKIVSYRQICCPRYENVTPLPIFFLALP